MGTGGEKVFGAWVVLWEDSAADLLVQEVGKIKPQATATNMGNAGVTTSC